jgi:hypothetical protein
MPTKRKRHMITETVEVETALEPLRLRGIPVSFHQLVIKGAETTMEEARAGEVEDTRRRAARERFLERMRTGAGLDLDVALDLSRPAWKRPSVERLLEDP